MANQQADKKETSEDRHLKSTLKFSESKTDRIAIGIMGVLGSIPFLVSCLLFFIFWILWNLHFLSFLKPFDVYPFPLLEMTVSLFAVVLSVSVIINQNRQSRIDKISRQVEFEVNVRAEEEITKILNMLHEIQQHLGMEPIKDKELQKMKEPTDIHEIHQTLDNKKNNTPKK